MKSLKIVYQYICIAITFYSLNACSSSDEQAPPPPVTIDISTPAITGSSSSLPLTDINLPDGFKIEIYAEVPGARQLAVSPSGIVYVGTLSSKANGSKVYALKDVDSDYKADKKWIVSDGLEDPSGVAFKDDALFIGTLGAIYKLSTIETLLNSPPAPTLVKAYPKGSTHNRKYLAFAPDGKLYMPLGSPCNACEPEGMFGSITRMNADGTEMEAYVTGVRNPVGIAWHPVSKELWFTDPGRDDLGATEPSCELNNAPTSNMNFGFPYCHAGFADPVLGTKHPCSDFIAPAEKLGPHITPLGLKFYTGDMFPTIYKNQLFVALKGAYNKPLNGHNITLVKMDENGKSNGFETFASGWLSNPDAKNTDDNGSWGRPIDVIFLKDGSMLVSDEKAGVVYRITYSE